MYTWIYRLLHQNKFWTIAFLHDTHKLHWQQRNCNVIPGHCDGWQHCSLNTFSLNRLCNYSYKGQHSMSLYFKLEYTVPGAHVWQHSPLIHRTHLLQRHSPQQWSTSTRVIHQGLHYCNIWVLQLHTVGYDEDRHNIPRIGSNAYLIYQNSIILNATKKVNTWDLISYHFKQ